MRIAIDARRNGFGITAYCESLISNLVETDHHNQYIVIRESDGQNKITEECGFKTVYVPYSAFSIETFICLHKVIHKEKADVFHSPSINLPLFCRCPMVLTVHDLIPLNFYKGHSRHKLMPAWITRLFVSCALNRADQIITVSQFTGDEIMNLAPSLKAKINVIYRSPNKSFEKPLNKNEIENIKDKFSLPHKIILHVGSMKPHKNIRRLLGAFQYLKKKESAADTSLILAGGEKENIVYFKNLVAEWGMEKDIIFTGMLTVNELIGLMSLAELFVFPSLYEGFGLPPLEAMACGIPVITSNRTSLPEVVGDAALQVNPESEKDIASAMHRLLTDKDLRRRFIQKGFERLRLFRAEEEAKKTLEVYEKAYESKENKCRS